MHRNNAVRKRIKKRKRLNPEPEKSLSFQVRKVPAYLYINGGGDRDNVHCEACQRATSKVPPPQPITTYYYFYYYYAQNVVNIRTPHHERAVN